MSAFYRHRAAKSNGDQGCPLENVMALLDEALMPAGRLSLS